MLRHVREPGMRPRTRPWASTSACVPHGCADQNLAAEQARGLLRARVQLPAYLQGMRDSGESTSSPRSGQWGPGLSALQRVRLCPRGSAQGRCQESQRGITKPCRGSRNRGQGSGVPVLCRQPLLPAGEGGRAAPPGQSSATSEQLLLFPSLAVGLPRYQHHPSPVCDRKDFVLNFNGISSFHPSASGSYYHHHHHQSVCQDIKPCVM